MAASRVEESPLGARSLDFARGTSGSPLVARDSTETRRFESDAPKLSLHAPLRLLVYSEGHLASGQLDQFRGDRVAVGEPADRRRPSRSRCHEADTCSRGASLQDAAQEEPDGRPES